MGDVTHGMRQECEIVSLKISNFDELKNSEDATRAIDESLMKAKDAKARIYISGDYRVLIFCPLVTGEEENSIRALTAGKIISDGLKKYNAGNSLKINFGIGINVGDVIVEKHGDKFKFNSVGDSVISAKRISNESLGDVLISKTLHGRAIGKVRSEKHPSKDYWVVRSVTDRSKYDEFLRRFREDKHLPD
jgi:hypothetical protein